MELLRLLTLVYAGVLVAALAISLIIILIHLWRIARVLGSVDAALREALNATHPLESLLGRLDEHVTAAHDSLGEAAACMEDADRALAGAAELAGVAAPAG
jgi:hypothetical protein